MKKIFFTTIETPIKPFSMILEQREDGLDVVRISGFDTLGNLRARLPADIRDHELVPSPSQRYAAEIRAYFAGDLAALNAITYQQNSSPFYEKVWAALCTIAPGHPVTYTQLATMVTNPRAVRAAGTACGKNLVALIVPCHRVVKSDGKSGSYLYGTAVKDYLLAHELRYGQ
jgi:methylated-DNA-[protein]-cysteine S-methyltransferase